MPHVEVSYPYEPLTKYPHLRPADIAIWDRFVAKNPNRFQRVWYDFRVGDAEDCPHEMHAPENCAWFDLTRWQIDVIGEDEKAIHVIEVKPFANSKAIGQALSYSKLFEEEQRPSKPVIPVVLTDRIIETTKRCAEHCGVLLWLA